MKPFLLSFLTPIGILLAKGQGFWINLQRFLKVVLLKWPVSFLTASRDSEKAYKLLHRPNPGKMVFILIFLAFGFINAQKIKAQTTLVGWDGPSMNYKIADYVNMILRNPIANTGIGGNVGVSYMQTFGGVPYASASTWYGDYNQVIFNESSPGNWANGTGTKGWIFSFTTRGYANLLFSGKMGATYAPDINWYGPRDFKLQYSLDNSTWLDVSGGAIAAAPDNQTAYANLASLNNVSLPTACDNQPLVYLRMVMASDISVKGTKVANGRSMLDDFMVKGMPLPDPPTVSTSAATGIGAVQAVLGGEVTSEGTATVTERGMVWATTADPTTSDHKIPMGNGIGSFSAAVSTLPPATLIHFRAYAINPGGTSYGANLTFTTNAALAATTSQSNVSCNGGSNGVASVTSVMGGVSPYTYSWSPSGGTGAMASGLVAGSYVCTITDNESTTIIKNFTLSQPSALTATTTQTSVSCNGGSNGTASVSVSGGTPPYTYSWSPSGGAGSFSSGKTAGNYVCTITDANSCQIQKTITITQPAPISFAAASKTNVSCYGGSNGAVSVTTVSGGTGPYTYDWTPGNPTGDGTLSITGIPAGTWTCKVTDANSCTKTQSYTITQPTAPVSSSMVVTYVACFGGTNGAINLTPSGGTGPYTYNWGGGIATEDRTGLFAGDYTCTITDANGCTGTVSATVIQPGAPVSGTTVITNVSCNGGTNGAINLTPTGGTGPYTFDWGNGITTEDRTGLAAETYTCQVTDAYGCTGTVSATVSQPTSISGFTVVTNVACNGGTNGAINLTPSGGTFPFTYNWGGGIATEDRTGLVAGTYTCIITDVNGCTATVLATVTQPEAPVSGTIVTQAHCDDAFAGTINLTPTGGTAPYTYNWGDGITTKDRTGDIFETYNCTITDANGCTGKVSAMIPYTRSMRVYTLSSTDVSCYGGSDGEATVSVSGGTPGYTYSWSPSGGTAASARGLTAGMYTCTVTDANGCTTNHDVYIWGPGPMDAFTFIEPVTCFGGSNGSIDLYVMGGSYSYTYNWADGITTQNRTDLAAGTYICTITDSKGCTKTVSATVGQSAAISATSVVTNVSCFGGSNGKIRLTVTGGISFYYFNWGDGVTTRDRNGLAAGTYTCTITDYYGCTETVSVTVTQPLAPVSGSTVVTNVACHGGNNGAINLTATGGIGPYTFNWGSGITTEDRTGLVAGTYTCQVTDASGCTATVSATVTQPTAPVSGTTVVTNVACYEGTNGAINLTPTGGVAPYTYHWGGDITTQDRSGLMAGSYSVIITDANGCTGTINVTVTQPVAPVSASFIVSDVSYVGGINGAIDLTPSGGTSPYTYIWGGGITTEDRSGLTAGLYTVTITDANLCSTTRSCYLIEPPAITTSSATQISITSASMGGDVTADGGTSIWEIGVVYSTSDMTPTIEEDATQVAMGTELGTFSQLVGSLTAETTYYLQAYAINPAGISYGGVQSFTTLPVCENPSSGGIIELDQSICSGAVPDVITNHTLPSGYSGMLEYKWQSSTTGASSGFQDLASSNSVSYAPGELFVNTWYRRLVKASCISDWTGAAVSNTVKITVNELPLAPVAETNSYIYDGTVKVALANVAEGETVIWYTDATGETPLAALSGINAGTYSAYAQARNTTTGCVSTSRTLVTLTIHKAILTVTADAQTKVYGKSNPTLSFTYTGWKNSDTETVLDTKPEATTTVDQFSDAGTYPGAIILTGGIDNNYDFIYVPANFTVIKLNQTITFPPFHVKTYGGEPFNLTAASNVGLDISYSSSNPQVAIISGHTLTIVGRGKTIIRASQLGNNLYKSSSSAQELIVGAKPLTVSGAAVSSKTYDGNTVATIRGASLSGILASDDVTLENSTNGTFARSTSGTGISVLTSMLLSGEDADNYILLQPEGLTANIEKKDIMVVAQPISKECHQSDPVLTYHFTPELIVNDSFTGTLTREEGNEHGEYKILIGSLSLSDNYNLIYQGAAFSIVDNSPSWITPPKALDRTVEYTDTYGLAEAQNLAPVAFDICDNEKPMPIKVSDGFEFGSDCKLTGKYTNTWTVQDKVGNTSETYTQVITIIDRLSPIVDNLPSIVYNVDPGVCETAITYPEFTIDDICIDKVELVAGLGKSGLFPIGTTLEKWKITDKSGNSAYLDFAVTIKTHNIAPKMDQVKDLTVIKNTSKVEVPLSGIDPTGGCEHQEIISLTAEAVNSTLISEILVSYEKGLPTGMLTLKIAENMVGESQVNVTLKDNGGSENSGSDTKVMTFIVKVDPLTHIQDSKQALQLVAYPNPTKGIITIKGMRPYKEMNIAVYSIDGRLIMTKTCSTTTNQIDLTNQVPGTYLLNVNEQAIKIIKE